MPATLPTAVKMLKEFRSADTLDGAEVVQLYHVYNLPFGVWDLAYNYVPAKGVVHPNAVYHGAIVVGRYIVRRWTDSQALAHALVRVIYSNNRHYSGGPMRSSIETPADEPYECPVWYRQDVTGQSTPIWIPGTVTVTRPGTIRVETRYVSGDYATMTSVRQRNALYSGWLFPMNGYFYRFRNARIDEDGQSGQARVAYHFYLPGAMPPQDGVNVAPYYSHLSVGELRAGEQWARVRPLTANADPSTGVVPANQTGRIPDNLLNSLFNLYPV